MVITAFKIIIIIKQTTKNMAHRTNPAKNPALMTGLELGGLSSTSEMKKQWHHKACKEMDQQLTGEKLTAFSVSTHFR